MRSRSASTLRSPALFALTRARARAVANAPLGLWQRCSDKTKRCGRAQHREETEKRDVLLCRAGKFRHSGTCRESAPAESPPYRASTAWMLCSVRRCHLACSYQAKRAKEEEVNLGIRQRAQAPIGRRANNPAQWCQVSRQTPGSEPVHFMLTTFMNSTSPPNLLGVWEHGRGLGGASYGWNGRCGWRWRLAATGRAIVRCCIGATVRPKSRCIMSHTYAVASSNLNEVVQQTSG